jgi:hypothetical protein
MLNSIEQFREDIGRVRAIGGLYGALGQISVPVLDETDLLRAQFVMAVSALDRYIHEITRVGMLESYDERRPRTNAFLRFQVGMEGVMTRLDDLSGNTWFEAEIRERHGYQAFQHPEKIADAVRLFSSCELWPSVASQLGLSVQEVKSELSLIVERRNKIAHESDVDPGFPGARWPISPLDSANAVSFIEDISEAIHIVVWQAI